MATTRRRSPLPAVLGDAVAEQVRQSHASALKQLQDAVGARQSYTLLVPLHGFRAASGWSFPVSGAGFGTVISSGSTTAPFGLSLSLPIGAVVTEIRADGNVAAVIGANLKADLFKVAADGAVTSIGGVQTTSGTGAVQVVFAQRFVVEDRCAYVARFSKTSSDSNTIFVSNVRVLYTY